VARGTLRELAVLFAAGARGEVSIVVGPQPRSACAAAGTPTDLDAEIRTRLAAGGGTREIASQLAAERGVPRREVYARTLALRGRGASRPSPD